MNAQRNSLRMLWKQAKVLVFNLPDDEVQSLKQRRQAKKEAPSPTEPVNTATDSKWAVAAQRAEAPESTKSKGADAPGESSSIHGWNTVQSTKRPFYKKVLRWGVGLLLFLFLVIGVRTAIWGPANVPKAPELPAEAKFPQQVAAGTAEEFATAYLNWDESSPSRRVQNMSLFYSGKIDQSPSGQLGWSGKGKQEADNAHAVRLNVLDDQHARVTVLSEVTTYKAVKGKSPAVSGHKKVALDVVVKATTAGATVTGVPGIVGVPSPIPGDDRAESVTEDTGLAESTKANATRFFQAYASGKDLESIAAPGARITGTNGYLSDPTMRTWTVIQGSGDTRQATAVVDWTVAGGSTSQQTYTVTLQKVSSGSTDRWMVSNLEGTQNNG